MSLTSPSNSSTKISPTVWIARQDEEIFQITEDLGSGEATPSVCRERLDQISKKLQTKQKINIIDWRAEKTPSFDVFKTEATREAAELCFKDLREAYQKLDQATTK